jgi:hypothetical protein
LVPKVRHATYPAATIHGGKPMTDYLAPGTYKVHTKTIRDMADRMDDDPTLGWGDVLSDEQEVCLMHVVLTVRRDAEPLGLNPASVLAVMCETDGTFVVDIGDVISLDFIDDNENDTFEGENNV